MLLVAQTGILSSRALPQHQISGNAPVPIYEMGSKMSWRPASEKIESMNAPTPPRFVA
jgi:hypothetical protein